MRYVNAYGEIVRMSERNYRKFLRDGMAGKNPIAGGYGRIVSVIDFNGTDARETDYEYALEELTQSHGR
jgi:hypothetical protein